MRRTALLLTFLAMILTGCKVNYGVVTTVNEDGSGTIELSIVLDRDLLGTLAEPEWLPLFRAHGGPIETLLADVPEGWNVERFTTDAGEGLRMRRSFASVSEIASHLGEGQRTGRNFPIEALPAQSDNVNLARGLTLTQEGTIFEFSFDADAAGLGKGSILGASDAATGSQPEWEFSFTVDLPGKVTSDNADHEHDGALEWHLHPGISRKLSATADSSLAEGGGSMLMPFSIGFLAAATLGGLVLRSRRKRDAGSDETPVPPAAAA